jgi:hypothetical protein
VANHQSRPLYKKPVARHTGSTSNESCIAVNMHKHGGLADLRESVELSPSLKKERKEKKH